MAIDMEKIQKGIEEGFKEGLEDADIAKKLDISDMQVKVIRGMLGLRYTWAVNVFEESKPLSWIESSERFNFPQFTIPPEVSEKLKLKDKKDYSFFASVIKPMTIQITILDREEK